MCEVQSMQYHQILEIYAVLMCGVCITINHTLTVT